MLATHFANVRLQASIALLADHFALNGVAFCWMSATSQRRTLVLLLPGLFVFFVTSDTVTPLPLCDWIQRPHLITAAPWTERPGPPDGDRQGGPLRADLEVQVTSLKPLHAASKIRGHKNFLPSSTTLSPNMPDSRCGFAHNPTSVPAYPMVHSKTADVSRSTNQIKSTSFSLSTVEQSKQQQLLASGSKPHVRDGVSRVRACLDRGCNPSAAVGAVATPADRELTSKSTRPSASSRALRELQAKSWTARALSAPAARPSARPCRRRRRPTRRASRRPPCTACPAAFRRSSSRRASRLVRAALLSC